MEGCPQLLKLIMYMKKLILFLFFMLPMVVNAQRIDKPGEPYEFFCVVVKGVGNSASISFSSKNYTYRNLYNNGAGFDNEADIINYMTKRGWQYVECISDKHFLFKKIVTSDEQAKEFLEIETKKEK